MLFLSTELYSRWVPLISRHLKVLWIASNVLSMHLGGNRPWVPQLPGDENGAYLKEARVRTLIDASSPTEIIISLF